MTVHIDLKSVIIHYKEFRKNPHLRDFDKKTMNNIAMIMVILMIMKKKKKKKKKLYV